jgi:hypothetical protein
MNAAPVMSMADAVAAVELTYEPAPAGAAPADTPRLFAAINSVMRDTMPVGKNQQNTQQNYKFRGIDDVMSAMAGPMRTHGVFILPNVASHRQERRGEKMTHTTIKMRYRIYGPAGDCLVAEVPGEASDFADKSTNKAQSAALKYLLFTLFMLPVDGRSIDDGDRDHPVEPPAEHRAERQQRQQQRRQQGQQRQQQPRRSDRAESGPGGQQPQQQTPRRDFLAEATKAPDRATFDQVRAAAVKAGAPADYLDRIDAVARQKANAANQPQRQQDPEPGDQPQQDKQQAPPSTAQAAAERSAALSEMYAAGKTAGCRNRAEVDTLLASKYQVTPKDATPDQIAAMTGDLLDVARSAAA